MDTPDQIKEHAAKYTDRAWEQYTIQELGAFVHLLAKRATHRADLGKRAKDLTDARNYHAMIGAHLTALEEGSGQ